MPTYSYVCTVCEHRFDAQQSFADAALTTCPECSGQLRKLFGNVGVVFKGPGFYRTDARAGNGRNGKPSKTSSSVPVTSGSGSSGNGSSSNGSSSNGSSSNGSSSGNGSSSNASSPSTSSSSSAASPAAASA